MEIPTDLYTTETLFSLSGSVAAVLIVTSVIGFLLDRRDSKAIRKWLGLFIAILLSLLGVTQQEDRELLTWVVAIFNGFLIYLTAVGANTIIGSETEDSKLKTSSKGTSGRNLLSRWW